MSKSRKDIIVSSESLDNVKRLATDIENVVKKLKEQDKALQSLSGNINSYMNSVSTSVTKLNSATRAIADLARTLSSTETKVVKGMKNITTSFNAIFKGNSKHIKLQLDLSEAKSKLAELRRELKQAVDSGDMGKASTLADYINIQKMYVRDAQTKVTNTRPNQQVLNTYERIKSLLDSIKTLDTEIARINGQIGTLTSKQVDDVRNLAKEWKDIAQSISQSRQGASNAQGGGGNNAQGRGGRARTQKEYGDEFDIDVPQRNDIAEERQQAQTQAEVNRQLNATARARTRNTQMTKEQTREMALQRQIEIELAGYEMRDLQLQAKRVAIGQRIVQIEQKIAEARNNGNKDLENELKREATNLKQEQSALEQYGGRGANFYNTSGQVIQVIRELPNFAISAQTGLMALSNNLPQLFEGFMLAAKGGRGLIGVLKMLFSPMTLLNVAFVAITMVIMNLDKIISYFKRNTIDVGEAIKKVSGELAEGNGELSDAIDGWIELSNTLYQAKNNILSGANALEEYNDKFGKMYGYALNVAEAYDLMEKNASKFYESVMRHEISMALIEQMQNKFKTALAEAMEEGDLEKYTDKQVFLSNIAKGTVEWNKLQSVTTAGGGNMATFGAYVKDYGKEFMRNLTKEQANEIAKVFKGANIKKGGERESDWVIGMSRFPNETEIAEISKLINKWNDTQFENLNNSEKVQKALTALISGREWAMQFGQMDMFNKDSGSGGGRRGSFSQRDFDVLDFREGYAKRVAYIEEEARLKKENELLELKMQDDIYQSEKDSLDKRLENWNNYYSNLDKLTEISSAKAIFKLDEENIAFEKSQRERLKQAENRLKNQKKDIDEYVKSGKTFDFSLQRGKAEENLKNVMSDYEKRIEEVGGEDKLSEADIKGWARNIEIATQEVELYSADTFEKAMAVYAKSLQNFKELQANIEEQIKQKTLSTEKEKNMEVEKLTINLIKNRQKQAKTYLDTIKTYLNQETSELKDEYDRRIKIVERYYERLNLVAQTSPLGLDDSDFFSWAMGEKGTKEGRVNDLANSIAVIGQGYGASTNDKLKSAYGTKREIRQAQDKRGETIDYRDNVLSAIDKAKGQFSQISGSLTSKDTFLADFQRYLEELEYSGDELTNLMDIAKNNFVEGMSFGDVFDKMSEDVKSSTGETIDNLDLIIEKQQEMAKADWLQAIQEQSAEFMKAFVELLNGLVDRQIELERRAVNEWREDQDELLQNQYESGIMTEKQYNAQKKALDEEQRKREHEIDVKEFKAKRAQSIAEVTMQGAVALAQALTTSFQGGLAQPVLFGIFAALVAATIGAQIGTILAQPLPAYKHGTSFHEGGLAIVGDGGRAELIETPSGELYKTPSKSTLVSLERGARVYPDYRKAIKDKDISGNNINVHVDTEKQLSLLRRTNNSLSIIARNTRTSRTNYNRIWKN